MALWLQGRAHYQQFMRRVFAIRGTGWPLQLVQANGGPALAAYAPAPATGHGCAHSLQVFAVSGGLSRSCVAFVDPALFDLFGLPTRLGPR